MYDLLICGKLVLPGATVPGGWLAIEGGTIVGIGVSQRPAARRVHDAGDAYVLPGFIDGQTHATSYSGLAGFETTSRSAVAGGVTTMVDMPYDNPDPLNTVDRLQQKIAAVEALSYCDVALYGTVVPGQGTEEMAALAKAGIAAIKISSFENHPTRFPRVPTDEMMAILQASVPLGLPVGLHNEDQELVRATIAALKAKGLTTPEWHEPSRPVAAEMGATAVFLALGAATGAHVHIVHVSCAEVLDLITQARAHGVNATAESCAHYFHFDATRDIPRLGALIKVNPPIRSGAQAGLWQRLNAGDVAFVSSDHSGWPADNKSTASIFDAGAGVPGLETLVPSFYTDLLDHTADPIRMLVRSLCEGPAQFFGLSPRKGALAIGADADVVVLQPGAVTFNAAHSHDALNWSPYDGEVFAAAIAASFVRGVMVWNGAEITARPGHGRFVSRHG